MKEGDAATVITAACALGSSTATKFTKSLKDLSSVMKASVKDCLNVTFETYLGLDELSAKWLTENLDHLNDGSALLFKNVSNLRLIEL